jgi:hypothetical protein
MAIRPTHIQAQPEVDGNREITCSPNKKTRPKAVSPYQSPRCLIVKNCQASAIRKRTMANRPAPITKKILLSSALGGASSAEPTRRPKIRSSPPRPG